MSFELFRRIAHDSISTPFLVPDDESVPRRCRRPTRDRGLCDTRPRDRRRDAPALHRRGPRRGDRRHAPPAQRSPDPRRRRRLPPGRARRSLFVALAGERTDGHRYLAAAVAARRGGPARRPAAGRRRGRAAARRARRRDGRARRRTRCGRCTRSRPPGAGGSTRWSSASPGSIAKTSTKEAVAGVLERRLVTLRTEGNQNNEVGLPLTVLRLGPEHEAAVLEMGMYVGGEIRELAAIGLPRDRDRDRGPAGPPVADRVARRDRGRQGRAASRRCRRPPTAASRSSTPTTSASAGWRRARRARGR